MQSNELIREMLDESPVWTQNKLGAKLGLSSQAMSNRMNAADLRAGFLAEMLAVLGYELVAVPSGSRLPAGSRKVGE